VIIVNEAKKSLPKKQFLLSGLKDFLPNYPKMATARQH
jgi:hypothetical protein